MDESKEWKGVNSVWGRGMNWGKGGDDYDVSKLFEYKISLRDVNEYFLIWTQHLVPTWASSLLSTLIPYSIVSWVKSTRFSLPFVRKKS